MKKILFSFFVALFIPRILAAEPLTFAVLSYNIHGLPSWIARDHPRLRIPFVVKKLLPYPAVLLQENFAYSKLVKKASHPLVFHGNTSRFGIFAFLFRPLCGNCGSGLIDLLNMPDADILATEQQPFERCSGWIRKNSDCWSTKGFLWIRLRFTNGAIVSLYNLHLDSGNARSDREARLTQLKQITLHLTTYAKKDGVIIGGDFNATLKELARFIHDSQLSLCGSDEKRDYIFFRKGERASIQCLKGEKCNSFPQLSDHDPIFALFSINP